MSVPTLMLASPRKSWCRRSSDPFLSSSYTCYKHFDWISGQTQQGWRLRQCFSCEHSLRGRGPKTYPDDEGLLHLEEVGEHDLRRPLWIKVVIYDFRPPQLHRLAVRSRHASPTVGIAESRYWRIIRMRGCYMGTINVATGVCVTMTCYVPHEQRSDVCI